MTLMTEEIKRDMQTLPLFDDCADTLPGAGPLSLEEIPQVIWSLGCNEDEERDPVCTIEFVSHSRQVDRQQRDDRH